MDNLTTWRELSATLTWDSLLVARNASTEAAVKKSVL
jgi:hypothetical protein